MATAQIAEPAVTASSITSEITDLVDEASFSHQFEVLAERREKLGKLDAADRGEVLDFIVSSTAASFRRSSDKLVLEKSLHENPLDCPAQRWVEVIRYFGGSFTLEQHQTLRGLCLEIYPVDQADKGWNARMLGARSFRDLWSCSFYEPDELRPWLAATCESALVPEGQADSLSELFETSGAYGVTNTKLHSQALQVWFDQKSFFPRHFCSGGAETHAGRFLLRREPVKAAAPLYAIQTAIRLASIQDFTISGVQEIGIRSALALVLLQQHYELRALTTSIIDLLREKSSDLSEGLRTGAAWGVRSLKSLTDGILEKRRPVAEQSREVGDNVMLVRFTDAAADHSAYPGLTQELCQVLTTSAEDRATQLSAARSLLFLCANHSIRLRREDVQAVQQALAGHRYNFESDAPHAAYGPYTAPRQDPRTGMTIDLFCAALSTE